MISSIFKLFILYQLVDIMSFKAPIFELAPEGYTTIESDAVTDWGDWNVVSFCEKNVMAIGFNTKVEEPQGDGDDTALNSIKLVCANDKEIYSGEGEWGQWGENAICPSGSYLNGFKLKVEPVQGDGDDTASNGIIMFCSDGTELNNNNEGQWGDWSENYMCPEEKNICGFRQQIEPPVGEGDDTAMNNVLFFCC